MDINSDNQQDNDLLIRQIIEIPLFVQNLDQTKRYLLLIGEDTSHKDILMKFIKGAQLRQKTDQNGQISIGLKQDSINIEQNSNYAQTYYYGDGNLEIINYPNILTQTNALQRIRNIVLLRKLIDKCKQMAVLLVIPFQYTYIIDHSSFFKLIDCLCSVIDLSNDNHCVSLIFTNLDSEEDSDDLIILLKNFMEELTNKNQPIIYEHALKQNKFSMFLKDISQSRQQLMAKIFQKLTFSQFQTLEIKKALKVYSYQKQDSEVIVRFQSQIRQFLDKYSKLMISLWSNLCLSIGDDSSHFIHDFESIKQNMQKYIIYEGNAEVQLQYLKNGIKVEKYFCFLVDLRYGSQLLDKDTDKNNFRKIINFFKINLGQQQPSFLKKYLSSFTAIVQSLYQIQKSNFLDKKLGVQQKKDLLSDSNKEINSQQLNNVFANILQNNLSRLLIIFSDLKQSPAYKKHEQLLQNIHCNFQQQKPQQQIIQTNNRIKRQYCMNITQQIDEIDWDVLHKRSRKRKNKYKNVNIISASKKIQEIFDNIQKNSQEDIIQSNLITIFDFLLQFNQITLGFYILFAANDIQAISLLVKYYLANSESNLTTQKSNEKAKLVIEEIIPYFSHKMNNPEFLQTSLESLMRCFNYLESIMCESPQKYEEYESTLKRYLSKAYKLQKKYKLQIQEIYENEYMESPFLKLLIKHKLMDKAVIKRSKGDIAIDLANISKYMNKIDKEPLFWRIEQKQNFQKLNEVKNITVSITSRYQQSLNT